MITHTSTTSRTGDYVPRASSGFPRVLYDTLIRLGYDGDAAVYVADCPRPTARTGVRLA
jgi:hypothetical protein